MSVLVGGPMDTAIGPACIGRRRFLAEIHILSVARSRQHNQDEQPTPHHRPLTAVL